MNPILYETFIGPISGETYVFIGCLVIVAIATLLVAIVVEQAFLLYRNWKSKKDIT